ncbi:MAG: 4-hydroxy-tetrahydrodipicolinate synthase [Chitinophagales bacterium]
MTQDKLIGTGVALVTPFHEDKSIDFDSLQKIIDHCIDGGVNYLVTLGTTGESVVLTKEEKQTVIHKTVAIVNGRVPLVAGFGGNNTQAVIDDINSYDLTGVDFILSASPNYNKPTQEGIYQHYKAISENSPLPIILYNVPGRTAKNMEAATTLRLAKDFDNIVAMKEASGNLEQCMEIARKKPADFVLLSGEDLLTMPMISFGCQGVISVVAQAAPQTFTTMINDALSGDFAKAKENHFKLMDLTNMLFAENNPAGVKAALCSIDKCKNELRLPIVPVTDSLFQLIENKMKKI